MVFVPKYGIKGPVYLKDKEGQLLIPQNALSLDPKNFKSAISINGAEFGESNNTMLLRTSKGEVGVQIFDHLTIKITSQESRAHRPPLKFELLNFGHESTLGSAPSTIQPVNKNKVQLDMANAIKEEEIASESLALKVPKANLLDYTLYAQTKSKASLYELIENLKNLSINENPPAVSKDKDQTVRFWKLKKRPKPEPLILDENHDEEYGYSNEATTEQELIEKRLEIEERNRSRMPVEQKFHQQIGRLEHTMREMKHAASLRKK